MWVRIVRDTRAFPLPHHRLAIHYTEGLEVRIKRAWGERLVASGAAIELPTPPRPSGS
jgi:hypothetical protein